MSKYFVELEDNFDGEDNKEKEIEIKCTLNMMADIKFWYMFVVE